MTTTTKNKPRKKFRKLEYYVDQLPGCCGIGVAMGFEVERGEWGVGVYRIAKNAHVTKEEQAQDVCRRLSSERGYAQLLVSLVSSYRDGLDAQLPELEEVLIAEGWTIYSVFINSNTGNEVTLYGKYFPDRIYEE